ncbi:hypothetical protein BGW80DRAFT_1450205 [Lactifluus volemus]|nr:hypothetical protein BGW80DRAFT_1450205 [Lactifluus volemus]
MLTTETSFASAMEFSSTPALFFHHGHPPPTSLSQARCCFRAALPSDAETKSAAALNAAVERRPSLPLSTVRPSREDSASNASPPSTPLQHVKLGSSSCPPTPGSHQPAFPMHYIRSSQSRQEEERGGGEGLRVRVRQSQRLCTWRVSSRAWIFRTRPALFRPKSMFRSFPL